MAAFFKTKQKTYSWHVGESLDNLNLSQSRVITIQADGDELVAILRALGYKRQIFGERIFTK